MNVSNTSKYWIDEELQIFRSSVHDFVRGELLPRAEQWRQQKHPDRADWRRAGEFGLLLTDIPEEYGGLGGTFAHFAVVLEELAFAGINFGAMVQSVVARYIHKYGSSVQKSDILPRLGRGELVAGIAMSEPAAGSDLQGIRATATKCDGGYLLNGSKSFVTNGYLANVLCIAVKTDIRARGSNGISLFLVETDGVAGINTGKPLEKLGMHDLDTCEIFLDNAFVPTNCLLGDVEGAGLAQMMSQLPYERLAIAVQAVATAEQAVEITSKYAKERHAFGRPLMEFQNTRFKLAECKASVEVGRAYLHQCIGRQISGQLDPVDAATAKYWTTECQAKVMDECLQLHGGYGYMTEYPIARMWADARMQRIGGGTSEVMKELIGWSI